MSARNASKEGSRKQAEVNLEALTPRCREAWEYRLAGKTTSQTAEAMRCTRDNVWTLWHQAMKRGRAGYQEQHPRSKEWLRLVEKGKALIANGRCRCGLLLPCGSCLPSTAAEWSAYAGGQGE
jgi:DNA-binding CsgD family transcriptional regulator